MPKRIQRRRSRGWRMSANCVSVTRPGIFGNPFTTAAKFRLVLEKIRSNQSEVALDCGIGEFVRMMTISNSLDELRGKDLACWCRLDRPCHADVLLELANAER